MEDQSEKIKELETKLGLLKEKLKISQSLVKIGFWELNSKTRQVFLSAEALEIVKLKTERQWIDIDEIIEIISENDKHNFKTGINKLILDKKSLDIDFSLNESINNESLTIKAKANPSGKNKKNRETIIGIVQDITAQKKTELFLKNAKNKAEEADILKSAFLANMSHEIRTPLNAILGFSRLLTNPEIPNNQRQEYSEYITNSANNLLNLIRDIVDISKIEAGKMIIEKSRCQVNKILKELKFTFEKEKNRQLKNQIEIILKKSNEDEEFAIYTDPYRFHQILVNLIGNALKFTETGYIEFGYIFQDDLNIQFYVKDTGIGIPDDKIDLIFSRFGQIIDNKIKNPGGTGLGLSITKHLISRLGGKIWVESTIDKGTKFTFTLPYEKVEEPTYKYINFKEEFDGFEIGKLKILAVEDDKINMILLEDTLKLHIENIDIVKAYNGIEAIHKLEQDDFDLIIMDIRMPLLDGYEATKRIRTEFPSPKNNIPILGLSAHALKNEIEAGRKIGMNDFLSKPIQPDELFSKIKKLISNIPIKTKLEIDEASRKAELVDIKSIDIQFFEKLYKNNIEKINHTLSVYLSQVPEQLNLLEKAFINKNDELLKNLSHSLKSTFKYLGRYDISEFAREIENASNEDNYDYFISEKIDKIKMNWLEIEKDIIERINKE